MDMDNKKMAVRLVYIKIWVFSVWAFCKVVPCSKRPNNIKNVLTQPAFTCSKLTIETLEQVVKYVQS